MHGALFIQLSELGFTVVAERIERAKTPEARADALERAWDQVEGAQRELWRYANVLAGTDATSRRQRLAQLSRELEDAKEEAILAGARRAS